MVPADIPLSRFAVDYGGRVVALDGARFRIVALRDFEFQVERMDGFVVGRARITSDGVSCDNAIVESLTRGWLRHCLEAGLDPWPQPSR